ncbi:unnamed protein product, partial [Prorocentrum cordatum]
FSVVPLSPPLEYNRDVPWLQHTSHRHGRGRIHLQKGHLPVRVTAYMKGSARSPALGGPAGDEFALPRAGGGRRAVAASPPHPSVKRRRPRARGAARAGREERERLRRRRLGREEQEEEERRTSGGEGGPGLAAGPTSRLELPLGPQEPAALGRAPPARQQGLPGRGGEQPRVL